MSNSKKESRIKDTSSGQKRVMFEDQHKDLDKRQGKAKDNVKKELFNKDSQKYGSNSLQSSHNYQSGSEPNSEEKYSRK